MPQKKKTSKTAPSRKKTTVAKAASKEKKAQRTPIKFPREIKGIIFIAIGLFLAVAFLSEAGGAVGAFIRNICYGFFGMSVAISCFFVIFTGVYIFIDKLDENSRVRYLYLALLIVFTSVLISLFTRDPELQFASLNEAIAAMWLSGVDGTGGGLIGDSICLLLSTLIGNAGAWVLTVAAELILIILLTGISFEKIFSFSPSKLAASLRDKFSRGEEDDEDDFELPEYSTQSKEVKRKLRNRKSKEFFDEYFEGEEPMDAENGVVKRFEFAQDDEMLGGILPENPEYIDKPNLPFDLDSLKTGVLTELPDEDGNYHPPVENEEGTDYEPPSEAKLEDVFDPLTQRAVDAGLSLDRAVVAGRRAATEDAEDLLPENQIKGEIEKEALKPKIIKYQLPSINLLEEPKPRAKSREEIKAELEDKANRLLDTLRSFKVDATIINITQGPSVTRFELQPGFGVKVSKITNLSEDIALSLAASGVRIEPVPGKSAIGIEIPNKTPSPVPIREVIASEKFSAFKSKTAFALGKDISGNCVVADIADFPHGLIAGATGSGKSVCINSLIMSILFKARPDEVKMIMVDPKMVELGVYNGIPHLLIPVVTDPKHAAGALNWAVGEMKNRYNLLKDNKVRNLKGYNKLMDEIGEPDAKLPEIVIIIDELADLMMAAKNEVEGAINSLAALARAAGMYLIIATQRPSVNVVTGVIKNNIPTRIAFAVTSNVDSRTILDTVGAEKLLGKGDMLYSPRGATKPMRIQGNFVSDREIESVIEYIKSQYEAEYDEAIIENIEREREQVTANTMQDYDEDDDREAGPKDKLFIEAVELILENGQASVAMFQRKFKIGYQRAVRLIDEMEKFKIIGPYEGTKPRQVLITRQEFNEMRMNYPD